VGSNLECSGPVRAAGLRAFVTLALGLIVAASIHSWGRSWGAPPEHGVDGIFFSKSFPGSKPEYFEVSVDATGKASYREDQTEEQPLEFTLAKDETRAVFDLAERLGRFERSLQSDLKIAFTGAKTLRYTNSAGDVQETRFSYSTDKDAQAIVGWFEKAGETERHRLELERVVRFDPLGVNKTLLLFQASFDDGRVVAAAQFLPILKTIAEQPKFMHMARARAASLVERIEAPRP